LHEITFLVTGKKAFCDREKWTSVFYCLSYAERTPESGNRVFLNWQAPNNLLPLEAKTARKLVRKHKKVK